MIINNEVDSKDLYNKIYYITADEPIDEAMEFVRDKALEFQEVVVEECRVVDSGK